MYQKEFIKDCKVGDSIAVNGCCLTIIRIEGQSLYFNVMLETINKTTFHSLKMNDQVHIEKALARNNIDGHPITGHIFRTIYLLSKTIEKDGSHILKFSLKNAPKYVTYKGCVAIDGVSLTVSKVFNDSFEVSLIPYTQEKTLLGMYPESNVEFFNISSDTSLELSNGNFMNLALKISKLGRITAPSNPWVGCVIVSNNNTIIATGFHRKRGEKHAERVALDSIPPNQSLEHATLYCTLEPCAFTSKTKLQPLCADLLIERGIRNVIIGISDPDDRMKGLGVQKLRQAGINVTVLEDSKVQKSLRSYIHHRKTMKPYVVGKMAISLDGKIALSNGDSKWISGEESRIDAHVLRAKSQAILIGTHTAIQDQPQLTVRLPETHELYQQSLEHKQTFIRCFLDAIGKVTTGPLLDVALGPVIAFTSDNCIASTKTLWQSLKIEVVTIPLNGHYLDLSAVLSELGKRGILQLLVEGGSQLMTQMVDLALIDELVLYQAPILLGNTAASWYLGQEPSSVAKSKRYQLHKVTQSGTDAKMVLLKSV